MAFNKIGVYNESTAISDAEVIKIVKALQIQIHRDWAPIWGEDADVLWRPKNAKPRSGLWKLVFLDNADQAGVLGYHDVTEEGLPLGKVFVKTTQASGGDVSVTASHEILEMLADPSINLIAHGVDAAGNMKFYAYEVCDAVEADRFAYEIDGVKVSDFVTPAWFESFRAPGSTKFSFKENVTAPFQLAQGGYIGVLEPGFGWTQLTARSNYSYHARPHPGSRREKRSIHRSQWLKSKPSK